MVNKDILDALELLTHKGFSKDSLRKHITYKNKKISKINQNLINKNIFLIDETGDIIFDIIKYKPKKINYHLKNTFSKYYIELKIMFMKKYNYNNYVNFFIKTSNNKKLFDYESYYKISGYLTETTRLFWDALYESSNYIGYQIRNSDLFEQKKYDVVKYIDEKNFNTIKSNINSIEINYFEEMIDQDIDYFILNNNCSKMYNDFLNVNLYQTIIF